MVRCFNLEFALNLTDMFALLLGSAIYAYCIIAPSTDKLDGFTDLRFFIDNEAVGSFTLDPSATGQNDYLYNVLVYGNSSIAPGSGPQHTFTLQNGHPGGNTSLAILDYIVYSCVLGFLGDRLLNCG